MKNKFDKFILSYNCVENYFCKYIYNFIRQRQQVQQKAIKHTGTKNK